MHADAAARTVSLVMRLLAGAFALVGILFIAVPDAVIGTLDDVGDALGSFSPGPETDQRLWLGLGFAYMMVITALAALVAADPRRNRPLLLVLALGKAASSLAAGAFFLWEDDVFAYLANFLVDGSLVALMLGCWALLGRPAPAPAAGARAAAPG